MNRASDSFAANDVRANRYFAALRRKSLSSTNHWIHRILLNGTNWCCCPSVVLLTGVRGVLVTITPHREVRLSRRDERTVGFASLGPTHRFLSEGLE